MGARSGLDALALEKRLVMLYVRQKSGTYVLRWVTIRPKIICPSLGSSQQATEEGRKKPQANAAQSATRRHMASAILKIRELKIRFISKIYGLQIPKRSIEKPNQINHAQIPSPASVVKQGRDWNFRRFIINILHESNVSKTDFEEVELK